MIAADEVHRTMGVQWSGGGIATAVRGVELLGKLVLESLRGDLAAARRINDSYPMQCLQNRRYRIPTLDNIYADCEFNWFGNH